MQIFLNQNLQLIMKSKKIYITAKEGNFLNKDEILLKKMLNLNQMILVLKLKK